MYRKLLADNINVAQIQEPWLSGRKIRGLSDNPRTCLYVKNMINSMANIRFCSRDATTMEVSAVVGGCRRTIRLSSVYLPYKDPEPPSVMMRDIVQHSAEEKREIILGIDANAHHTLWETTDISLRGESLMNIW
jgi:hypothetical protein